MLLLFGRRSLVCRMLGSISNVLVGAGTGREILAFLVAVSARLRAVSATRAVS